MQDKKIKDYEIDIDKYDFSKSKVIGSGAFGVIYKVKNSQTKENYAAKKIYVKDKKTKRMINHEIQVMSTISDPTIIKFHGFSYQNSSVTILMDLMAQGDLDKILNQTAKSLFKRGFDNTSRQIILVGISYGMMILHRNNIVHCDLKPGNVLIDEKFHPHISDFGSSEFIRNHCEKIKSKVNAFSIYTAPEILNGKAFDAKADVYSFAMILYHILTGKRPFPYTDKLSKKLNLIQKISEENYRPDIPESIPKSFEKLLKRCWNKDPKKRPNSEEIFNRLAFNKSCFVFDIFDDENEEEEECDDANEQSYYLDKVDTNKLFQYIDLITKKSNFEKLKVKVDDQQNVINSMKKRIKKNKEYIFKQNEIIDELKEQINNQQITIKSMKERIKKNEESISEQSNIIDKQKNKIKKQKLRLNENEKQIKDLIDNKSQNSAIQQSSLPSLNKTQISFQSLTKRKIKSPKIIPLTSTSSIRPYTKSPKVKKRDEEHKESENEDEHLPEDGLRLTRRNIIFQPLPKIKYNEELSDKSKRDEDEDESHLDKARLLASKEDETKEEESEKEHNKEESLSSETEYKEETLSDKSKEEEEEDESHLDKARLSSSKKDEIKEEESEKEQYNKEESSSETEYKEETLSDKSKEEDDED